jgi:hypothetical protein
LSALPKVPIVGLGHGCGALLHSLISSLFPDYNKSANVLLSYHSEANLHLLPVYDEILLPLTKRLAQVVPVGTVVPMGEDLFSFAKKYFQTALDIYTKSQLSPAFLSEDVLPLVQQGSQLLTQVGPVLQELAEGRAQFRPGPAHTNEVLRMMYRCPRTLSVSFTGEDSGSASSSNGDTEITKLLREADTIMRMRRQRSLDALAVEEVHISGSRSTPCSPSMLLSIFNSTSSGASSNGAVQTLRSLMGPVERQFSSLHAKHSSNMQRLVATVVEYVGEVVEGRAEPKVRETVGYRYQVNVADIGKVEHTNTAINEPISTSSSTTSTTSTSNTISTESPAVNNDEISKEAVLKHIDDLRAQRLQKLYSTVDTITSGTTSTTTDNINNDVSTSSSVSTTSTTAPMKQSFRSLGVAASKRYNI